MAKAMATTGTHRNLLDTLNEENPNLTMNHFADMVYLRNYIAVQLQTRIKASTSSDANLAGTLPMTASTSTGYTNYLNDWTDYFYFVDFNLKDNNFLREIDYVLAGLVFSDFTLYLDMKLGHCTNLDTHGICHHFETVKL